MSQSETIFHKLSNWLSIAVSNFASLWTLYQALIVAACLAMGWFLAKLITPPLEARLRRINDQPGLLRLLVIPLRRLPWLLGALTLLATAAIMREITWPSRSYLVMLAGQLVGAWVIIRIGSRMIRNRMLGRILAFLGWAVATLIIIGHTDTAIRALDAVGFPVGSGRLSLLVLVKGLMTLVLLLWIAFVVSDFTENRLRKSKDLTPTYQVLAAKLLKGALFLLAMMLTLDAMGIDLTALAVFSGALGLGLGFGLQKVASNLISGIIILLDKSIKPGDVISVGDKFGWITRLQSRYVSVNTRDGVEHLIPNEQLISEKVINWSHSNRQVRLEITFGVSYDDDPHLVREITVAALKEIPRIMSHPAPVCHIAGFGDSSIDFVLRFWINDPENGTTNVCGTAYLAVWDAFKANGVSIPYRHHDVRLESPVRIELGRPSRGASGRRSEMRADVTVPVGEKSVT